MPDKPIDELYIDVDTNSNNAQNGVEHLAKSLEKLKSALTGLDKLDNVAKNVKELNIPKSTSDSIDRLSRAVQTLSGADTDKATKSVSKTLDAIKQFNDAPKSLNSAVNALNRLNNVDASKINDDLYSIYQSIKRFGNLPQNVQSVINSLGQLASQAAATQRVIQAVGDTAAAATQKAGNKTPTRATTKVTTAYDTVNTARAASIERAASSVDKLNRALKPVDYLIHELNNSMGKLSSKVKNIAKEFGKAFRTMAKPIKAIVKPIKSIIKLFDKLKSKLTSTGKSGRSMGNYLKEAFRGVLVYGGMFQLLSTAMNSVTEGIQNMAKGSERFNKTMSSLATSMLYMRNALTTAIAPLLNAVAPVIDALADKFAKAANAVGMFFSRLTGQNVFTQAVKTQVDYAAGLDKTSSSAEDATKSVDKMKKSLAGFDEINLINEQSSASNSDDTNQNYETPTGDFIDVPAVSPLADKLRAMWENSDFEGIGDLAASKLNSIINKINNLDWNGISQKINNSITSITTIFNSFLTNTDWVGLGTNIGNAVNTVVSALDTLFTSFDFAALGTSFADTINGIFYSVKWSDIGKTFSDGVHGILQFLISGIEGVDWKQVGTALMDALNGIEWDTIGEDLGRLLGDVFVLACDLLTGIISGLPELIDGLTSGIWTAIESIPWDEVASATFELLGAALGAFVKGGINNVLRTVQFIENLSQSIQDYFSQYFDWGDTPEEIVTGLLNGIKDWFIDIGDWIYDNMIKPFVDGFKEGFGIHSPSTVMEEQGGYITDGLVNGIGDVWSKVKGKFDTFKTKVTSWFDEKSEDFKSWGSDIIDKITDGIGDIWKKVKTKFDDFKTNIKDFFSGLDIFNIKVEWEAKSFAGTTINVPKLSFYETGGFPASGEVFIARENGMPEMVGGFGNRTAVANNDQIVQGISAGVYNAVVAAMGVNQGNGNQDISLTVNLDGDPIYRNVIQRHNSEVIMTGMSPLALGG